MEAAKQRMYLCIDGKSFYASVECAERGLNPFETNLVVADPSRGKNALCLAISFCETRDEGCEGYDLFTDWEKVDKEKAVERTVLEIRDRFGKNAVLRGINLNKSGTQRERNTFIGGHRAGYDDERKPR